MTTETTTETVTPAEEEVFMSGVTEDRLRAFAKGQMKRADRLDAKHESKKKQKRVEKAVAVWHTTATSWMEQIQNTSFAMAKRSGQTPIASLLPSSQRTS
jgi:hypothetical protein